MDTLNARVSDPSPDTRPEPPAMHAMYLCRYWEWKNPLSWSAKGPEFWGLCTSMFPTTTLAEAEKQAQELIRKGCRNVQIITIPGQEAQ